MFSSALRKIFSSKLALQILCQHENTKITSVSKRHAGLLKGPCGVCDHNTARLEMDPACKVALVIGGVSGIGYQTASQLLKEGAKAVAITGLNTAMGKEAVHSLNNTFGHKKSMFINANNHCTVQLEETCRVVKKKYKQIDILVNAAGVLNGKKWEQEIVTNLVGAIRANLIAYRHIGREGGGPGGVCVHIAGVSGLNPAPPAPTLCASMHGIVGMSRSFGHSSHVKRSGVRIVCLCPGITTTDFWRSIETKGMTQKIGAELAQWIASSKKQKPESVGQAVCQVIKCALSGSVWVIDASKLYEIDLKSWEKSAILRNQFI